MVTFIDGKAVIIKTSKKVYITDIDLAMDVVKCVLDAYKKNAKHLGIDHRPFDRKRYDLDVEGEIGTIPVLKRELKFWLDSGYHVSEIFCQGFSGVITINTDIDIDFHY